MNICRSTQRALEADIGDQTVSVNILARSEQVQVHTRTMVDITSDGRDRW